MSNFTIAHLKRAEEILGSGRIHIDQVEIQPWLQNRKLIDHCLGRGIRPTACAPSQEQGGRRRDPARDPGCAASQVGLAWLMQRGIAVIPASANPDRMRSNFAARDVTLTQDEMERIAGLDSGERIITPTMGRTGTYGGERCTRR